MKRLLRWVGGFTAALLVLLLVALSSRNWILKQAAVRAVAEHTGLRAEIGSVRSGLRSPFLLVQNIRLFNLPEFGGGLLLDAPELYARFDAGQLHIKEMRLTIAELTVIRNAEGQFNLDHLETEYRKRDDERRHRKPSKGTSEPEFPGIDRLDVSIGAIHYIDQLNPKDSRTVRVALTNEVAVGLKTRDDLLNWTGTLLSRVLAQHFVEKLNEKERYRRFELQFGPETNQPAPAPPP